MWDGPRDGATLRGTPYTAGGVLKVQQRTVGRGPAAFLRPRGRIRSIVLAAITFTQILEILALLVVVHVVLLAPFMLAGFLSWLEYHENDKTRRARRHTA